MPEVRSFGDLIEAVVATLSLATSIAACGGVVGSSSGSKDAQAERDAGAVEAGPADVRDVRDVRDGGRPDAPPARDGGAAVLEATAIAAGEGFTCALRPSGDVACWGENAFGQIGHAPSADPKCFRGPCVDAPKGVVGLRSVVALAAGSYHACAVTAVGEVECWGSNPGDLPDGGTQSSFGPARVAGLTDALAVAGGYSSTCALRKDGTVECWGDNSLGELGHDPAGDPACGHGSCAPSPAPVPGLSDVTAIAAGDTHACALLKAGTVACWGDNRLGQLGNGSMSAAYSFVPTTVPGLTGVTAIAAAGGHTCALSSAGTVQCWGSAVQGDLGNVPSLDSYCAGPRKTFTPCDPTPSPVVSLGGVVAIAAGETSTCAVLGDGTAACWGGITGGGLAPSNIPGLSGVTAIAVGASHACAMTKARAVLCWGQDEDGELGDGMTSPSPLPPGPVRF